MRRDGVYLNYEGCGTHVEDDGTRGGAMRVGDIQDITPEEARDLVELVLNDEIGEWEDVYIPEVHGTLAEWTEMLKREQAPE